MAKFLEKSLIEDYIINELQQKGQNFIPADSLERINYEEPLLIPALSRNLKAINKDLGVGS